MKTIKQQTERKPEIPSGFFYWQTGGSKSIVPKLGSLA
jgi:hypothetical protein